MLDLNNIKIPYWYSILIIVVIIIIVIFINESFVKIKTNQCDNNCKLINNEEYYYFK